MYNQPDITPRLLRMMLLCCIMLLPLFSLAATPTMLRVVDLRWITGQPELETWLGSLQGAVNRQETEEAAIFLVRNGNDAAWAEALVRTYHLQKETLTPGALLNLLKPKLTGQVLYAPAEPWTRNIALTAAATAPGVVVATDTDLGAPTVLDLRGRWKTRGEAYAWALTEYGGKANPREYALAPESGHLLADLIVSRKLLAVDFSPKDADETAALKAIDKRYPAESWVVGAPDDRAGDDAVAFWQLTDLLRENGHILAPARNVTNLSCFARFPVTRPLLQGRNEFTPSEGNSGLLLIYDGGNPIINGSQSLDYAADTLFRLLNDPALVNIPVGVEVSPALYTYAPAMYQLLLARQRMTAAEMIAAPNGTGWALPLLMADPTAYLQRSSKDAQRMNLTGVDLFDLGGNVAYGNVLTSLAGSGWRGAIVRPVAVESLPDHQPRTDVNLPGFVAQVSYGRVRSLDELRTALAARDKENAARKAKNQLPENFQVLYVDPEGLPPSTLQTMLPEISKSRVLLTPSQFFRMKEEATAVNAWMLAQVQAGDRQPGRRKPTLRVSVPVATEQAPTATDPIHITVRIEGKNPVFTARLLYKMPTGRLGAADLRAAGNGDWTAVLPPLLTGGTVAVRARVVEANGYGVAASDPLLLQLPIVDTDQDGLEDTLEAYVGSDAKNPDSDGDGLPDGPDANPIRVDRAIADMITPILPPDDAALLTNAGKSTTDAGGRLIPAGDSVTYRIPLKDFPGRSYLRIDTIGKGTVSLNGSASSALDSLPDELATTDLPLVWITGGEVTIKLTAGDKPLRLAAIAVTSNPNGPYLLPAQLSPAFPAAGEPIPLRVTAFDAAGIKAVQVKYGKDLRNLTTLALAPVEGTFNTVFVGEIPPQSNGSLLVYGVEALNREGSIAAGPYTAVPVGRTRKPTVALVGGRELRGAWEPAPVWGNMGRIFTDGDGTDTCLFPVRPGTYYVWVLAQPRVRGVGVKVEYVAKVLGQYELKLGKAVPGGSPDGWYKLGKFTIPELMRLHVTVGPVGETGYCAYGEVVLTQDDLFTPPLAHAGLDWYNSITLNGLSNGQTVSGKVKVSVVATGNIDLIDITADKFGGSMSNNVTHHFDKTPDGAYVLNTTNLLPGTYIIRASGYRIVTDGPKPSQDKLVTVTVRINVAPK
ncbi:MAG: hypothetical protein ACYDBB_09865 [Armatimonadota bacterium]